MPEPDANELRAFPYVAVAWLTALLLAFANGGTWWSLHTRLTVVGFVLEAIGIFLLASDLLLDRLRFAVSQISERSVAAVRGLIAKLRGPTPQTAVKANAAMAHAAASAATIKITGSAEDPVVALRREVSELRDRLAGLEGKQAREIADVRTDLLKARDEVLDAIQHSIAEAKDEYFSWRLAGFGIALLGSGLLAAANLV